MQLHVGGFDSALEMQETFEKSPKVATLCLKHVAILSHFGS